jgi:DNA-binding NtrC family response regulator
MKPIQISIVEDNEWYADLLEYHLKLNPDYSVSKYINGEDFLKNLHPKPDVITLDYSLPDIKCESLIGRIKEYDSEIPIIIISGQEDIKTAIDLLKKGVYDYIVKDEDTKDRLWNTIRHLRENLELKSENERLREEVGQKFDFSQVIVGNSEPIKKLFTLMGKTIDSSISVSISGETGTGKELVAKAIHFNSNRKKHPFVAINVGAIPGELIESELFGHEKGAFTGAIQQRIGKFEEAHKGTLFLDEIGEMDPNTQSKLLRVLQERELVRVGGNKKIKVDVRIVTATHKNLAEEVKKGNFRQDLYYRLMGIPIKLPPLRERNKDILILSQHFANAFTKENKRKKVSFSSDAQKKLMSYAYPGNVRELKAIVELAIIMADNNEIQESDIHFENFDSAANFLSEETSLENYTIKIVKHFLDKYDKNGVIVAQKLGVAKSTIYRMIKKHNLLE